MSGSVPSIEPGMITNITGLKRRPVYFLTLGVSPVPNLVVKGERQGDNNGSDDDVKLSVHWTSKLMKNVNSKQVNTRPLSANEYNYFQHAVGLSFGLGTPQRDNLSAGYNWVKMPFVEGLSDAGYNEAKPNEQTIIIKKALKNLLNPDAWKQLGGVVAVDVFNANNDRFNIKTGDWVNKGNMMFDKDGKILGLDTFDPGSFGGGNELAPGRSNLMTAQQATYNELKMLKDPGMVTPFATKCLMSIGRQFQANLSKSGKQTISVGVGDGVVFFVVSELDKYFYTNYLQDFVAGFNEGARLLKDYLVKKKIQYGAPTRAMPVPMVPGQRPTSPVPPLRPAAPPPPQQKSLPAGVIARMQYLGW